MKLLRRLILILLFVMSYQLAQARETIEVGFFRVKNLTKIKQLNYLDKVILQYWQAFFKKHKAIQFRQLRSIPRVVSLKALSKANPKLDYAVLASYTLRAEGVILLKIVIADIKNQKELDKIEVTLKVPFSPKAYKELNEASSNLLWAMIGVPFRIYTDPPKGEVYINKEFIGRTPLKRLRGTKGEHRLVIYKKGFILIKENIVLKRGTESTFYYPLKTDNFLKRKTKINIKYAFSLVEDNNTRVDPYIPILFSFEQFIDNFSFEIETGIINFERETSITNSPGLTEIKTISLVPLTFGLKYHLFQEELISPYFGLGGGIAFLSVAENKSSRTNPMFYFAAGVNLGFVKLSESSSRLGFFVEGRYFNAGKVVVGESTFNPVGPKSTDGTEITINGFSVVVGVSYIFF